MTWRRIVRFAPSEGTGLEHLHVYGRDDVIVARGTIIGDMDGTAFGIHYEINLDPDWTFRSVIFQRTDGVMKVITSDGKGNWADYNDPLPELQGCIDIDISGTPFTNTLPIRRNRNWVTGQPQRFDMAWVPLDTLEPFKDGQIYTPLGGRKWRFQAEDGTFEAEIAVDEDGLVVDYPGLFSRVK